MIGQADLSDRGLSWMIAQGRDLEAILKDAKPELMAVAAGSTVIDKDHPEKGGLYTAPADIEHFSVHNADGSDTPYGFDKKTGRAFQLTDGGAPAGAAPTGVGMSPKAVEVASTLSAAGLPAPVVAGFMGNFHVEGGYDGAQGDGGSASGIGQWHSDRAATFQRVIGKPVMEASPAEQARFVLWEMQNPQAAGMTVAQRDKILAAKTPAEAAALIDQHYERSSGRDRQGRIAAANAFAGGSAPTSGTGTPIRGAPLPHDAGDDDTAKFIGGQVALGQPMPPLGMGKEAAAMRRAILAEATKQWKAMGISPGEANVIAAQNKSGLAELARIATIKANVLTAENTANSNASQVLSLLGNTGTTGSPIFNAWQQSGRRATGDSKVSAFDVAVKTLATEYARVMSGRRQFNAFRRGPPRSRRAHSHLNDARPVPRRHSPDEGRYVEPERRDRAGAAGDAGSDPDGRTGCAERSCCTGSGRHPDDHLNRPRAHPRARSSAPRTAGP
jgi:hypothetical protein